MDLATKNYQNYTEFGEHRGAEGMSENGRKKYPEKKKEQQYVGRKCSMSDI